MKKLLMILITTLFLVGCQSTKNIKIEKEVGLLKTVQERGYVVCGPSMAEIDKDGNIISIKNKMPDQSGSLKLGGTAKSLTEKKKEKKTKVLTQ